MSKLGERGQRIFNKMFLKIISVRVMDINLVKYVINAENLVKIGHFFVKMVKIGSFWHILGAKMTSYVKIWGKWLNNVFQKVSKIISVRFMDIKLVRNVINCVNLVKIGHFW